jgi:anti-anti-sigma regulatory factor
MRTIVESGVPGESIVTFGVRNSAGVLNLTANSLSQRDIEVLFKQILALAQRVDGRLVLDATMVRPLNCTWINCLLDLHYRCQHAGGQLVIAGLPADAEDIIRSTGLTKTLVLVDSREDGVQLLNGGGAKTGLLDWLLGRRAA